MPPVQARTECQGEGCRGAPTLPPQIASPGSSKFEAPGTITAPKSKLIRGAKTTLRLALPERGNLSVVGRGLKPVKEDASGTVTVTLALSPSADKRRAEEGLLQNQRGSALHNAVGRPLEGGNRAEIHQRREGQGREMIAHRKRFGLVLAAAVLCLAGLVPLAAQARNFEIPTFVSPGRGQDLTPSVTAGAHPFELFNRFAVDRSPTADELPNGGHEGPTENVKDLSFELPSGMVASAASFPQCNQEAFSGGNCPATTQVGVARGRPRRWAGGDHGADLQHGAAAGDTRAVRLPPPAQQRPHQLPCPLQAATTA